MESGYELQFALDTPDAPDPDTVIKHVPRVQSR